MAEVRRAAREPSAHAAKLKLLERKRKLLEPKRKLLEPKRREPRLRLFRRVRSALIFTPSMIRSLKEHPES